MTYARSLRVSALDRADLIDALQDAYDDLSYRVDGPDYENVDRAMIRAKLERWLALVNRIADLSTGRSDAHRAAISEGMIAANARRKLRDAGKDWRGKTR